MKNTPEWRPNGLWLQRFGCILIALLSFAWQNTHAQMRPMPMNPGQTVPINDTASRRGRQLSGDELLDTLRKREENRGDSVVYTSKFVKVTNERLLNDSTQVFPLDTGIVGFENYSPLLQPRSPRIYLGSLGLPQRPLLFEPAKSIGFDVGIHSLDAYMLTPQDINYYRSRVAYTNLTYIGGIVNNPTAEQVFRLVHTQNLKPNWNVGANFNTIGSRGFHRRQNVGDMNAAVFTWYESRSKRYNLLANAFFNNLKVPESGSYTDDLFSSTTTASFNRYYENVRLASSNINQRNNGLYIKQFYYLGRIDTIQGTGKEAAKILPTQRIAHTLFYNVRKYKFTQNEADTYKVFPDAYYSNNLSTDSLALTDIRNDFSYSFYLRGKSVSFVKNEVKLDVGLTHDLYHYKQHVLDSVLVNSVYTTQKVKLKDETFQNVKLNARFSYRFSDRVGLEGDFQQVAQGYNFGDYLYDARLTVSGGERAGRIILGAYAQNNKAPLIFTDWISNHYIYQNTDIGKQKTNNVSFNYINDKLQLDLKAEYFLITGYQYFRSLTPGGIDAVPAQLSSAINLLKISVGKTINWGRWHFEDFFVYQKSDYQTTLRTPEIYNFANLSYTKKFFNVLNTTLGVNVRYNTTYVAPSYAVGISQFYNGADVTFNSYPIITPYIKATLYRTNLFVQYDYANQGLQSNGYYTVNRYPMPDKLIKFGVSWTFYN
ncbi:putative porin [Mucilaginibacter lacusdianchii]|uniref:putative porin n=1 Tax=Mucilaginibacter lacusdianchii TaxID=2684211 RepID=UPI001E49FF5A|nr:putative porin [Mucilaginibacter sp. JXJ CY 39]